MHTPIGELTDKELLAELMADHIRGHDLDAEVLPSKEEVAKFNQKQKLLKQRREG